MQKANTKMKTIQIRLAMMANDFGLKTNWGNFPTASTSPGIVNMPYFDADNPTQAAAAMGFAMHEGSHHRYHSDMDTYAKVMTMQGPTHKRALNVIDDGRVDRRAILEYPGLKGEYEAIEQLFIDRRQTAAPTDKSQPLSVLFAYLAYYIGSELLTYAPLKPIWEETSAVAAAKFPAALLTQLQIIAEMGIMSGQFEASVTSANDFMQAIKDSLEDLKQQQDAQDENDSDSEDDDSEADADSEGEGDDSEADADSEGEGDDSEAGADSEGEGDDSEAGANGGPSCKKPTADLQQMIEQLEQCVQAIEQGDLPDNLRDKGEMLSEMIEGDPAFSHTTPICPQINICARDQGKSRHLNSVMAASRPITQALEALIEIETNCAPGLSRRGKRFVTSRLNRFLQGDQRVYRGKAKNIGIDSSILVSLDLSGSMMGRERVAKEACLALAIAIQNIEGANIAVQTFGEYNIDLLRFDEEASACSVRFDNIMAMGSTPMKEALSNAFLAILPERAEKKSVIVITDGEPDTDCTETFNTLRDEGIDVFGVYIGEYNQGQRAMDYYFRPGNWIAVNELLDLKKQLFKLAETSFFSK